MPSTVQSKHFEFGIGPGCTRRGADGKPAGQALPPVRIKEVCESLNRNVGEKGEKIRCCIESICDEDFSPAMRCSSGLVESVIPPE